MDQPWINWISYYQSRWPIKKCCYNKLSHMMLKRDFNKTFCSLLLLGKSFNKITLQRAKLFSLGMSFFLLFYFESRSELWVLQNYRVAMFFVQIFQFKAKKFIFSFLNWDSFFQYNFIEKERTEILLVIFPLKRYFGNWK